jgi:hypothetical protein
VAVKRAERKEAVARGATMSVLPIPASVELSYNYELVAAEHRQPVRAAALEIKRGLVRTQQELITIGSRLIEVKDRLAHGQFADWLKVEFELSERMAQRMMNVAEVYGDKSDTVSVFSQSALYLLAAPSTPKAARQAAVVEAQTTGKRPTKKRTQEIIDMHKAPEPPPTPPEPAQPTPSTGSELAPSSSRGQALPAELAARGWQLIRTRMGKYYGLHSFDHRSTPLAMEVTTVIDDIYARQRNLAPAAQEDLGHRREYHRQKAIEHLRRMLEAAPDDAPVLLSMIERLEAMLA